MVGSWGRSEDGSAPSSDLVGSWGKTWGQKMGQPGLKTGAPSSNRGLGQTSLKTGQVGRWGTTRTPSGMAQKKTYQFYNVRNDTSNKIILNTKYLPCTNPIHCSRTL